MADFTPPENQEALDALINGATAKVHKKYEGFDEFKTKAQRAEDLEAENARLKGAKPDDKKTEDLPKALSPEDVQKAIDAAIEKTRTEERADRALDNATTALDRALTGRTFEPSKLLTVDRKQFVTDKNEVDHDAIKDWVDKNSAQGPKKRAFDLGQGSRDSVKSGSNVSAGKDLFDQRHPRKSTP